MLTTARRNVVLVLAALAVAAASSCQPAPPSGWADVSPPYDQEPATMATGLTHVSCVPGGSCLATEAVNGRQTPLGERLVRWDGTGWNTVPAAVDGPVRSLSCATATFCARLDDGAIATWNGTTWQTVPAGEAWATPGGAAPAGAGEVDCASPSWCVAVRDGWATAWDGGRWRAMGRLTGADHVSCTAADACLAASARGGAFHRWDGSRWSPVRPDDTAGAVSVHDLDCAADDDCLVAGASGGSIPVPPRSGFATGPTPATAPTPPPTGPPTTGYPPRTARLWHWDGTALRPAASQPTGEVSRLACGAPGRCLATRIGAAPVALAGGRWTNVPLPQPSWAGAAIVGLGCAPAACLAVGSTNGTPVGPRARSAAFRWTWSG